ncbi:uncharacterized protein LOC111288931 [Durio zibethinus]|uniref:Uncharacterized protein LOC111288931 n=1 Tax=Durio zibethinus TaxID=66656 RepID=A0A6P5Y5A4_DURZI|nr:uncharacterized protein LOC111288931 [Durio zibethinus]
MEIREAAAVDMDKQVVPKTLSEILFENAMKDQWKQVVETYKKNDESHKAVLTASSDTALHLAVSDGKPEIVSELVDSLGKNASEILKMKNKRGNTPLHTAAALGYLSMCHQMASKDHSLIAECNNENETPLFLAAHFGHKDAFLCLHFLYKGSRSEILRRKANGDTILHAAIKGEFFSLAFQVIRKYPELVNDVNADGFTPLHILAAKPNAFKSGSRLGRFDWIIYRCLIVNEPNEIHRDNNNAAYLERFKGRKDPWYPENYGTCAEFFRMLFGVVFYGLTLEKIRSAKAICFQKNDEENAASQKRISNHGKGPVEEEEVKQDSLKRGYLPPNYATFIQFLKFLMNLLLIVMGFAYIWNITGFRRIKKIIAKKERHTWALQVMNELIEKTSLYKYNEGGTAKDEEFDINFDPRLSGAAQGVEAEKNVYPKVDQLRQVGPNSPLVTKEAEGPSNKEGILAPMESFIKEYRIVGSVDSKSSKLAVKMAFEKKVAHEPKRTESPILIAARMGVTEMVEKILEKFPVSIQDLDANNKNILLLAVENRQTHTFRFLIERKTPLHESVFRQRDNQGNNALHLAAKYGEYRPWLIPGSALQMQWELKWYKFVKNSISQHLLVHYNRKNQTPKQIFTETHKSIVKDGSEWLTKTSESCSLVAALIATVAFATSATIPGGVKEETGKPVLGDEPAFSVFSIASLVALCFSVTALVFFLAILTSRFEEKDFAHKLPWKLILGLTALFTSIAAILVSFCAGHFFELRDKLKFAAFPIYVVTCLPVSFFALAQLPLYFDLLRAIIQEVPQRSNKEFTH